MLTVARVLVISIAAVAVVVGDDAPSPTSRRDVVATPGRAARLPSDTATTHVSMRNVDFYVDPDVVLHIRLDGTMRAKNGGPVVFDDKDSFIIRLDRAEVGLTGADLTAEGLIRIHPTKTKILGVNGNKLMHAFGLSLEKLIDLKGATGATVHGNDLFLDPARILPPPAIEGKLTAVRVQGDEVVQVFGANGTNARPRPVPPDTLAPNYMYYKGGTLRFGKLLMLDAEMQIVDLDPNDIFRFDLSRYSQQLVAGYERTLPDQGLEVWMRDVDKLGTAGHARATPVL